MRWRLSRGGLDIEGLGVKQLEKLIAAGLVSDPASLWDLQEAVLAELPGWGELLRLRQTWGVIAARGLTESQARRAFVRALRADPKLGPRGVDLVLEEKKRILNRDLGLELVETQEAADDLGCAPGEPPCSGGETCGTALRLGSLWACRLALVSAIPMVIRTALEDNMLQVELPGYKEYTQAVRYRLIPGVS